MSNILFTSNKNYMKRDSSSGSDTMLGPNTAQYTFYYRDYTVNHNLGYTPMFRAYYEPFQNGVLYEAIQDNQYYLTNPINTYGGSADGPTCFVKADNNTLTFTLYFTSSSLSAVSFPIYWVIYQDYGASS